MLVQLFDLVWESNPYGSSIKSLKCPCCNFCLVFYLSFSYEVPTLKEHHAWGFQCMQFHLQVTAETSPSAGNLTAPDKENKARGGLRGLSWHFPWCNHFAVFRHTQALAHILALYRHGVFFWPLSELILKTRDTGPKCYVLEKIWIIKKWHFLEYFCWSFNHLEKTDLIQNKVQHWHINKCYS